MALTLNDLKEALLTVSTNLYHYTAPKNGAVPYLVWAEDTRSDFIADNKHVEAGIEGTIDFFTRTENDPLKEAVEAVLNDLPIGWYLNSIQYEEDTGLIHFEWVFNLYG